ncbi:hypothetical protein C8J55DRAFT_562099 [Lentinula edodes]|uniref:HNH nuclease domain-containing protein n=1 Tax=Lentinula lateritia TaxID=40482 RepID=A0A9W9A789_9AGAR|nr:hypothetical protein C8J55DRAFT_562099 [Lentinula edodes]
MYLRFLAYAILALDGVVRDATGTLMIADDTQLEEYSIYVFSLSTPVAAEELAAGRADCHDTIFTRDGISLVNEVPDMLSQALHVVAYARGTPWLLHLISMRRGFEDCEGVENLENIDVPRNGFCGQFTLHPYYDCHTPNHVPRTNDIPSSPLCNRRGESPPSDSRYTLQFLDDNPIFEQNYIPNNTDGASHRGHNSSFRPFTFLLHYRYGPSALVHEATVPVGRSMKLRHDRAKERKRKKSERQEGAMDNTLWTIKAVFEAYDPLDVLKMILPWYDNEIEEAFD